MAARAMWKGNLVLDSKPVAVKLYSAVQDRDIHFHLLDASSEERVRQHYVRRDTADAVEKEEVQKGYEVEPGEFVVIQEKELEAIEPKASRDIEVVRFVPDAALDQQWYERPYYLGPDKDDDKEYYAIAEALEREKREGIARWVMRKKRYVGSLRPYHGYLMLVTLRNAEEVLSPRDLPQPKGRAADPRELKMAQQLVSILEGEFKPEKFHNEYRARVMNYIEAKAKGHAPKLHAVPRKSEPRSLVETLEASLKSARGGKGKAVA